MVSVSVIVASYNHGKYIGNLIESILNQTYNDIELLIADDCSTDNSAEIINSYKNVCEQKLKRFVFLTKEKNKGITDSLNSLLKMAEGEYICPVGSDDMLKPDAVETLYNFIKDKPEYGFVGGNSEIMDEEGRICYWDKNAEIVYDKNEADYLTWADFSRYTAKAYTNMEYDSNAFGNYRSLLYGNYIVNGYLFKKQAMIEAGGYKYNVFEDWCMNLEIAKKYKFKYIDKIVYSYRRHSKNVTKNTKYSTPRLWTTIATQYEYCKENGLLDVWRQCLTGGVELTEAERDFIVEYLNKAESENGLILNTASIIREKYKKINTLNEEIAYLKKKKSLLKKFLRLFYKKY